MTMPVSSLALNVKFANNKVIQRAVLNLDNMDVSQRISWSLKVVLE